MTERITDRPRPLPELVSEHSGELSRANIGTGRVTTTVSRPNARAARMAGDAPPSAQSCPAPVRRDGPGPRSRGTLTLQVSDRAVPMSGRRNRTPCARTTLLPAPALASGRWWSGRCASTQKLQLCRRSVAYSVSPGPKAIAKT